MNRKTEEAYFSEQWDKMKACLKAFIENGDQELLHDFRVQVKRLRGMLIMLDVYSSKQLLRYFKPVKKIFKQGGQIRDAYLHLQAGVNYHIENPKFMESQQLVIDEGIENFKVRKEEYLKTLKKAHSEIEDNLQQISNKNIVDYYITELKQIAATLAVIKFDDTLHSCRRQIKILIYNLKFTRKALADKLQVNENYLDDLQGEIGNWHDNILAVELFSVPEINEKLIVAKLKRQNTRLKRSVINKAAGFWAKATTVEQTIAEVKHK